MWSTATCCTSATRCSYVRNITDVGHLTGDTDDGEDKIGKKARLENLEPMEVVQRYTNDFHDVMRVFHILPPSIEPTATGHIVEQIGMIATHHRKRLRLRSQWECLFRCPEIRRDPRLWCAQRPTH